MKPSTKTNLEKKDQPYSMVGRWRFKGQATEKDVAFGAMVKMLLETPALEITMSGIKSQLYSKL